MTPSITMNGTFSGETTATAALAAAATATAPVHTPKCDLSCPPAFNVAGGRPEERCGTRGSFTHGVRIMSGGHARETPLDAEVVDHGKVLFESSIYKPDLSAVACTNAVGGRPTERLGARGGFTPGTKAFLGGASRDVPIKAEYDHGKVLFVSSAYKRDVSVKVRSNAVRVTGRLGSGGRFTPGARRWSGGQPRDVPLPRVRDPGTVIFQSSKLPQSNLTAILAEETNVAGGRGDERLGRVGTFEHGVVEATGGPLHMPSNSPREMELWREGGQKENKYRRNGPSHFVAGVSILSGGMPAY